LVETLDLLETLRVQLLELVVREIFRRVRCFSVLGFWLLLEVGADHDAACWAFCRTGVAELLLRRDKDVWDLRVFAHDGKVRDDVDGRDIRGKDQDAKIRAVNGREGKLNEPKHSPFLALPDTFHHLLHAAFYLTGFGG